VNSWETARRMMLLAMLVGVVTLGGASSLSEAHIVSSGVLSNAVDATPPEPNVADAQAKPSGPLAPSVSLPSAGESAVASASGWVTLMTEDFEGSFPGTMWSLVGDPTWGKEGYRSHTGSSSAYCAGGGADAVDPPGPYPNDMAAWMIYGPFDLSEVSDAELLFYRWHKSELDQDMLMWGATTSGPSSTFYGRRSWGDSGGWQSVNFDLTDVYTLGDLTGEPEVWIGIYFRSNESNADEGAFVDDVMLRVRMGGRGAQAFLPLVARSRPPESVTEPVTSSEGDVISTESGVQVQVVPGTVPRRADGSESTTTFSIETLAEPPAPLPSGTELASGLGVVKFGPAGFTFAEPVGLKIPHSTTPQYADDLALLRYQPSRGQWLNYPALIEEDAVSLAGYDLGCAAVVSANPSSQALGTSSLDDVLGPQACQTCGGAFWWEKTTCPVDAGYTSNYCWYYFTIISWDLKYPEQANNWPDPNCAYPSEPWRCLGMKTGSDPTATWPRCDGPKVVDPVYRDHVCLWRLPQGRHQLCVTALEGPIHLRAPRKTTYSLPAVVNMTESAYYDYPWGWRNVASVELPPGGVWREASEQPCPQPSPTIPVGTGDFQATLTWVNTEEQATDLDLHLFGPGGLHVFYNDTQEGNLELDRDAREFDRGTMIENIYNTGPMAAGEYRVEVRRYTGSHTVYQLRVIRPGSVNTYALSTPPDQRTVETFTVD